jgi:hypothetical protein
MSLLILAWRVRFRAIPAAADRDCRARHTSADGDTAALDLLLHERRLRLGRRIKMNEDGPKSGGENRKAAADPLEEVLVFLGF